MTWEEKFAALGCLGECSLKMREPRNWFVDLRGVEIGGDGMSLSTTTEIGATPELAVEECFHTLTNLPHGKKYLVIDGGLSTRRHVHWNGYMWKDIPREESECTTS